MIRISSQSVGHKTKEVMFQSNALVIKLCDYRLKSSNKGLLITCLAR